MLKFWKVKCCREVLGYPLTTIFLCLSFIYVYLVFLIPHALRVITIMTLWQFVHLGTHIFDYMLLAFKKFCVDVSRKIQLQYDTNKNHVNFFMVPFLIYTSQFLYFFWFKYLENWSPAKNCSCKNFKSFYF